MRDNLRMLSRTIAGDGHHDVDDRHDKGEPSLSDRAGSAYIADAKREITSTFQVREPISHNRRIFSIYIHSPVHIRH